MDDLTPQAPPPRIVSITKMLLIIFLASVVIAGGIVFTGKFLIGKAVKSIKTMKPFTEDPLKIQEWLGEIDMNQMPLPTGYKYKGAFKLAAGPVGLRWFLIAQDATPTNLEKDPDQAFNLGAYGMPAFLLMDNSGLQDSQDAPLVDMRKKLDEQGPTKILQEKIWISGKEAPAIFSETEKNGNIIHSVVVPYSDHALLVGIIPVAFLGTAPVREMIAGVYKVTPDQVSLTAPEPPKPVVTPTPVKKKAVSKSAKKKGKTSSKAKKKKRR